MTTRYATDMVTFYDPSFWGLADDEALREFTAASPEKFWGTVMDSLVAAGVQDVELTFAPGDPASVLAAFGSPEAFRSEMSSRGLGVISAFIGESDNVDWRDVTDVAAVVADAEARAAFLAAAGGSVLVTGLPMRRTFGERPPFFVDAAYMGRMAEIAHTVGEATLQQGIRTAFHTESSSSLWYERDIDLFMQFTDPRYVFLCPDSCHITLSGGDPVALANRHLQRIALAHWKDATGVMDIHPVIDETIFKTQQAFMTELGTGVVDWAGWSAAMLRTPGAGTVLVELDEAADPVAAMAAGRAVVETVRA